MSLFERVCVLRERYRGRDARVLGTTERCERVRRRVAGEPLGHELVGPVEQLRVTMALGHADAEDATARELDSVVLEVRLRSPVEVLALVEPQRLEHEMLGLVVPRARKA